MAIKSIRERWKAQEEKKKKKILEEWEKAGKPGGKNLEEWATKVSNEDVDRKFGIFYAILYGGFWVFWIALILINDESVTWESFFHGLLQFLLRGGVAALIIWGLSSIKEDTRKILGCIALIIAIIWIAIAIGGAIGGVGGVIVAIIILRVFGIL